MSHLYPTVKTALGDSNIKIVTINDEATKVAAPVTEVLIYRQLYMQTLLIGIPHETHGEVPRAYFIPKANSKIDIPKLEQFISEKVVDYKKIRGGICVTDNNPKNASGKILRRMLKQQYEEEQTQ